MILLHCAYVVVQRLQAKVIKIVDVSYGGENGFNQAIELASEALGNVKFIQEKKLIGVISLLFCFNVIILIIWCFNSVQLWFLAQLCELIVYSLKSCVSVCVCMLTRIASKQCCHQVNRNK